MSGKRSFSHLVQLAFIYAEADRLAYADADKGPDGEEAKALAGEFNKLRMKRWGKTKLERALEDATPVDIHEILARLK
jgi:hypothetical protein